VNLGDPVRCGFSDLSLLSLEYWNTRLRGDNNCVCVGILAAHCVRGLLENFPLSIRGRREDQVLAAPAVSRANAHSKNAHEHTGTDGAFRPSLRNGFTAYFVLFPENGSFASVAPRDNP
jgi:hypothetical protein